MTADKIQNLGCNLNDPKLKQTLEHISLLPAVTKPIVCLPDIHMKDKTEAPCSFVVATDNVIIPELTAPSVGCGMGIVLTSLMRESITSEKLETFYKHMQEHRGKHYGTFKNILLWLGIVDREHAKYDFSKQDLVNVIHNGAKAAAHRYNCPTLEVGHIEYGGDIMDEQTEREFPLENILPRVAWASGRHDIGYGFKGNHFLEVQYIEEIKNEEVAARWGLTKNQVVIMYHGGGGAVSHYMGRYFAKRKKDTNSLKSRAFQFFAKFLFHFASLEGLHNFRTRWNYYFRPEPFQQIPADTPEGKRLMASIKASLNYSYAFRFAIAKRISDALLETFSNVHTALLWDSAHNSIHEESIDDKNYIIHRHTATRVFEGKPVLISGWNTTNSYIGIGLSHAEEHLFSADHGAGETIKQAHEAKTSRPHPESYTTDIYTSKPPHKKTASHITNEGLDAVVRPLEKAGLMRPVAYTRPIAVFKG
jgi:tRNA-splicing ligase RtcB (3'-phosphate/5'-hydroxy nucleic acid ligase)